MAIAARLGLLDKMQPPREFPRRPQIRLAIARADHQADFLHAGAQRFLDDHAQRRLGGAVPIHQRLQGQRPLIAPAAVITAFLIFMATRMTPVPATVNSTRRRISRSRRPPQHAPGHSFFFRRPRVHFYFLPIPGRSAAARYRSRLPPRCFADRVSCLQALVATVASAKLAPRRGHKAPHAWRFGRVCFCPTLCGNSRPPAQTLLRGAPHDPGRRNQKRRQTPPRHRHHRRCRRRPKTHQARNPRRTHPGQARRSLQRTAARCRPARLPPRPRPQAPHRKTLRRRHAQHRQAANHRRGLPESRRRQQARRHRRTGNRPQKNRAPRIRPAQPLLRSRSHPGIRPPLHRSHQGQKAHPRSQ